MEDLVTVVIPTWHRPDRILRAVNSAQKQTCRVQIIVVDDNGIGTKEQRATQSMLLEKSGNGEILYLVNERNCGGSYSRNRGLHQAQGDYITFLDDDDEIAPRKLEVQMKMLREAGSAYTCCYCAYHKISASGKIYRSHETVAGDVLPYALARSIYLGSGSNLLVRTQTARMIGGYDESFKRNQDLEFFVRVVEQGKLVYAPYDLLTIHYEIREEKRDYQQLVDIDAFYLKKMEKRIATLTDEQKKAVYQVVALERWRYGLSRGRYWDGLRNLQKNRVTVRLWLDYVGYLLKRVLCRQSFGFKWMGKESADGAK